MVRIVLSPQRAKWRLAQAHDERGISRQTVVRGSLVFSGHPASPRALFSRRGKVRAEPGASLRGGESANPFRSLQLASSEPLSPGRRDGVGVAEDLPFYGITQSSGLSRRYGIKQYRSQPSTSRWRYD